MIYIKKRGLSIKVSETKELKTPCKINTDNLNINLLLLKLKKNGIDLENDIEYSNDIIIPNKSIKKIKTEQKNNINNNNEINKKLDFIIDEIIKLKSKETVIYKTEKINNTNEKSKFDDLDNENEFIPTIDISDFDLDKNINSSSFKSDNNLDDNINKLKTLFK